MTATVTGFHGAKPGDEPYFSPRFRVTQKSNAGKYYKKKGLHTLIEGDDYLNHFEATSSLEFEIEDILSSKYSEFGFVKTYKERLRRRGLDPKQLYCVNRHNVPETPRTCLTSLPKLNRRFLVQHGFPKSKNTILNFPAPENELLSYRIRSYRSIEENSGTENCANGDNIGEKLESKLDIRLRELDDDATVRGFIARQRNHGRPLGNVTSSSHLFELLEDVKEESERRSSIFYRTEIL